MKNNTYFQFVPITQDIVDGLEDKKLYSAQIGGLPTLVLRHHLKEEAYGKDVEILLPIESHEVSDVDILRVLQNHSSPYHGTMNEGEMFISIKDSQSVIDRIKKVFLKQKDK